MASWLDSGTSWGYEVNLTLPSNTFKNSLVQQWSSQLGLYLSVLLILKVSFKLLKQFSIEIKTDSYQRAIEKSKKNIYLLYPALIVIVIMAHQPCCDTSHAISRGQWFVSFYRGSYWRATCVSRSMMLSHLASGLRSLYHEGWTPNPNLQHMSCGSTTPEQKIYA